MRENVRVDVIVGKDCRRVIERGDLALPDVDGPLAKGDFFQSAETTSTHALQRHSVPKVGFLRRKPVPIHGRRECPADRSYMFQPGQCAALVQQVIGGEFAQPEILPPDRLVLPTVPVGDVRKDPARLLFCRAIFDVYRHIFSQARIQQVDFLLPLADSRAGIAFAERRPIYPCAFSNEEGADIFQPVPETSGRIAVVPVIGLYRRLRRSTR